MGNFSLFFHEHVGDFSIGAGLVSYLVGILFLTSLDSPVFVICSYLGTTLFVGGIIYKLGLFPTKWKSMGIIPMMLFLISALAFTTAMDALFIGVNLRYNVLAGRNAGGPSQPPTSTFDYGYGSSLPSIEVSEYGNLNLQIVRSLTPWITPLIVLGIVFLVIGVAAVWLVKGF